MRRVLRGLLVALGVLAIGLLGLCAGARLADGPLGPFPGGPLRSGELVAGAEPDWSFAGPIPTIELEVAPGAPRSVTTWVLVHEGTLYVPAGLAARKRWPGQVVGDGRVVLRIEGRRFERQATRVEDLALVAALQQALARKYGLEPETAADPDTWFFRLGPRPAG